MRRLLFLVGVSLLACVLPLAADQAAESLREHQAEILPDALTVKMIYWFHPADYWLFLEASQKTNLEIKRAFEREGLRFALPTTRMRVIPDGSRADEIPMGELGEKS